MINRKVFFSFVLFCVLSSICNAQLPSYLPTNGLVAWYAFNGDLLNGSSPNSSAAAGSCTLSADRFGNANACFEFDSQLGDYIRITNTSVIAETNRTYSIWFTAPATYQDWYDVLFHADNINGGDIIGIIGGHPNYIADGTSGRCIDNRTGATTISSFNDGNWHNLILVHDYDQSRAVLYIDGNEQASIYNPSAFTIIAPLQSFTLGSATPGLEDGHAVHEGKLDDLAIWNRALSQNEVLQVYQGSSTGSNTGGSSTGSGNASSTHAPPGIPYQAEVRSESGEVLANANVNIRFTLHEQAANGTVSYQETHALTTNELGLFAATIGAGTATQDTFAGINWSQTTKFLQVEVDAGNGYITMGNQQLMSVPYALYAANGPVGPQGPAGPGGSQGSTGATGLGITSTQIANDSLIVTYSNSQTQNAGKVKTSYIAGNGISINNDTISATNSNSIANAPNLTGRTNIGFASSGIWICPAGVTQIMVQLWGGGGGGGSGFAGNFTVGCASNCVFKTGRNGGNGGNGGYNRQLVAVVPGMVYDITVGSGGIGGNAVCGSGSSNSGSAGGISIFNNQLSAGGGGGGSGGSGCSDGDNGISAAVVNYNANNITMAIQSVSSPIGYIPNGYITTIILPASQAVGGAGGAGGSQPSCGPCPTGGGNGQNGFCVISY